MANDTITVTLETDDESDEIEVSEALVEILSEGDEGVPTVVGDLAVLGLAQQAHGVVHHSQGGVSDELEAAEELTMELFEERFGQSYGEVTGHSH
jgi:hypothetical protein